MLTLDITFSTWVSILAMSTSLLTLSLNLEQVKVLLRKETISSETDVDKMYTGTDIQTNLTDIRVAHKHSHKSYPAVLTST